jgi:hypothetical protein
MGDDAGSALPSIPVDLDQLVDLLQGGEHHAGGRLNVRTGEALPDLMFADEAEQFDEDEEAVEDEWLYVDELDSREAYGDMERFIADIVTPLIAGPLSEAITGKGAFARFRSRIVLGGAGVSGVARGDGGGGDDLGIGVDANVSFVAVESTCDGLRPVPGLRVDGGDHPVFRDPPRDPKHPRLVLIEVLTEHGGQQRRRLGHRLGQFAALKHRQ